MSTTITGSSVTTPLVTADDLVVDTSTITVDATNNRVGVNKTTPAEALDVSGTVKATTFSGSGSGLTGTSLWGPKGNRTFSQTSGEVADDTAVSHAPGSYGAYVEAVYALPFSTTSIQATHSVTIKLEMKDAWAIVSSTITNASSVRLNNTTTWGTIDAYPFDEYTGFMPLVYAHPRLDLASVDASVAAERKMTIPKDLNKTYASETGSKVAVLNQTYTDLNVFEDDMLLITYRGYVASSGSIDFTFTNTVGVPFRFVGCNYTLSSFQI